jgi:hypothetical protein
MNIFRRLIIALNNNAEMIHDIHCGGNIEAYAPVKEPIPAIMQCRHCGCEVAPDEDTHVCTSMELP